MTSFKDFVAEDSKVFFNALEFAEPHTVAEKECLVVISSENKNKSDGRFDDNYVNTESFSFLVKKSDIGFKPLVDNYIDFDSESYMVDNVVDKFDTYEVFLTAYRG